MPKITKSKFYAVAVGRDAPNIYTTWAECSEKVTRYPKALHRSFNTRVEAEEWLASTMSARYSRAPSTLDSAARGTRMSPIIIDPDERSHPTKDLVDNIPSPEEVEKPVVLSPEQSKVLTRVKERKNVFFTGSAGTGKSVLLREIIKLRGDPTLVAITASTGIAAVNIGGCTLHSWAGIGLGTDPAKNYVGKFRSQPKFESVRLRWEQVQTLIIDEISMIDGELFDKLEFIARGIRNSTAPFGGIQLVLCGDFCQLPPVPDNQGKKSGKSQVKFAFQAQSWDDCIGQPMMLTKVFRQKDQTFVNMLNEMRFAQMEESTIQIFKSLSRTVNYTDGIEPTELFPTRKEVEVANNWRLQQLPGEPRIYTADDTPGRDSNDQRISRERMTQLLDRLVVPSLITLKVGAQVMLLKNLVQGRLVNGSIGQIVNFCCLREPRSATLQTESDSTRKARLQNPTEGNPSSEWPLVRFTNGEEVLICPEEFTINNANSKMEARRIQVPLILAWALSVHKSQGQTLERVRVNLRKTFEKGQAYVALSRATSMEHLQVLNFDASKVMVHPDVLMWYGKGSPMEEDEYDFDDDTLEAFDDYHF